MIAVEFNNMNWLLFYVALNVNGAAFNAFIVIPYLI